MSFSFQENLSWIFFNFFWLAKLFSAHFTKFVMSNKTKLHSDNSVDENSFLNEDFATLFEEHEKDTQRLVEGSVVKGVVVSISDKVIGVDIGAKSIGFVDRSEFRNEEEKEIELGDVVDVFLNRLENKKGELVISYKDAYRYNSWKFLEQCLEDKTVIEGMILGRVKGGYAADVKGITCFLPRSQVDVSIPTDDSFLIHSKEQLMVLKMDRERGNVVVSRRALLESQNNIEKERVLATIRVGDCIMGVVKNLTPYGAFISLNEGKVDGLVHLTDISWNRIKSPSEVLQLGQEVKVQVIRFDEATKRISLGIKQLLDNPWVTIANRYPVGSTVKGRVTNLTSYGAFVEIESGIEGLVHVSEMSWLKNNTAPSKSLAAGQEVEVMVLEINSNDRRISLGMKQCRQNPWQVFSEGHKVGDIVEGIVRNTTEFGIFVAFDSGVEGLVHTSDISSTEKSEEAIKKYKKDDKIKVMVLGSNYEKERISLGIKQIDNSNFLNELSKIKEGSVVSCVISAVKKDFLEVELDSSIQGIIKRLDLSKDKHAQRTERFKQGDYVTAKVTVFNPVSGKLLLSIRAMEEDGEVEYSAPSSSSVGGNTVGDIAGVGDVLGSLKDRNLSD